MFICIAGLGLLVASDEITKKDWTAVARGKGDGFMIAGATLYGFSVFSVGCPLKKTLNGIYSECNGRILCSKTSALRGMFLSFSFKFGGNR